MPPPTPAKLKVIIAMRNKIFSTHFCDVLHLHFDEIMDNIYSCTHNQEVMTIHRAYQPGLVIMDTKLADGYSFSTMKTLISENPEVKIIGVSGQIVPDMLDTLQALGACAYFSRNDDVPQMVAVVKAVVDQRHSLQGHPLIVSKRLE